MWYWIYCSIFPSVLENAGRSIYMNLHLFFIWFFFFFSSQEVCLDFPSLDYWTSLECPILYLARSHTVLHASAYAQQLLPWRINGIDIPETKLFHAFKKIMLSNYLGNFIFSLSEYQADTWLLWLFLLSWKRWKS